VGWEQLSQKPSLHPDSDHTLHFGRHHRFTIILRHSFCILEDNFNKYNFMKKHIFIATAFAALFLTSCNKEKQATDSASTPVDSVAAKPSDSAAVSGAQDEIVKSTSKDSSGKTLDMTFNNTKNTATVVFNNETIELQGQKPASGIWYKNNHYELRGKGEEIELTKDGKTVFKK